MEEQLIFTDLFAGNPPAYEKAIANLAIDKSTAIPITPNRSKQFTFIDLFAGIGGFRKGLEALGGKCVFTCEKDKHAIDTYKANFDCSDHIIHNDITKLKGSDIPQYDILCAGFPCQSFSMAGFRKNKKTGLEVESKGALFFDLVRIIKETKPKAFILENVKNLLNHDKGNTFKAIKNTIENDLCYNIQYRVINSKHFVPQARERIFIIGFRDRNDFDFSKLQLPNSIFTLKEALEKNPNERYTLTDKGWNMAKAHKERHKLKGHGFGYRLLDINKPCLTLVATYSNPGSLYIQQKDRNPRRLTPLEYSRLMGFNSMNGNSFEFPENNNSAYKQFGNAVVPQVVEWIGRGIVEFI